MANSDRDNNSSSTSNPKRISWISKYAKERDQSTSSLQSLPAPPEGKEVTDYQSPPLAASTHSPLAGGLPFSRSSSGISGSSPPSSINTDRSTVPSRRSSSSSLTKQRLDQEASQIILGALVRTNSAQFGVPAHYFPDVGERLAGVGRHRVEVVRVARRGREILPDVSHPARVGAVAVVEQGVGVGRLRRVAIASDRVVIAPTGRLVEGHLPSADAAADIPPDRAPS